MAAQLSEEDPRRQPAGLARTLARRAAVPQPQASNLRPKALPPPSPGPAGLEAEPRAKTVLTCWLRRAALSPWSGSSSPHITRPRRWLRPWRRSSGSSGSATGPRATGSRPPQARPRLNFHASHTSERLAGSRRGWRRAAGAISGRDRGSADPLLDFLGWSTFPEKAWLTGYWISLDFLGFSRPNLDFSMGYVGFSGIKISRALPRRETPGTGAHALADAEGGIGHGDELSPTSDFTQLIVRDLFEQCVGSTRYVRFR